MDLTTAVTAIKILNGTWTAVQNMRERVQASTDNALKISYGELLNDFNSLRTIVVKLSDENAELQKEGQRPKPEIRHFGMVNYYFLAESGGESGPYCQPCYDKEHRLRPLTARHKMGSGTGRKCLTCGTPFIEEEAPARRSQIEYNPYGPNGWMR